MKNKKAIIGISYLLIFTVLISMNLVNASYPIVTNNHKDEIKVDTPLRIFVEVSQDGFPIENANVQLSIVPFGGGIPNILNEYTNQKGKAAFKYTETGVIGQFGINTSVTLNGVWIGGCISYFNVT